MPQDTSPQRIERVTSRLEVTAEWTKLMTVDCQAGTPAFWYVVGAWTKNKMQVVECGSKNSWEELREVQQSREVKDFTVGVDSGYGAKSDAEVYKNCVRFGEFEDRLEQLPLHSAGCRPRECRGARGGRTMKPV